ncbi:unnamed protein product [Polarella glacialis]|uniref:Cellulase n=1 Tax=Polarella glacialis TaxID=89957 RepID=A0A813JP27_POLGL|nr:unnamed protein product [Polarella glacialis]
MARAGLSMVRALLRGLLVLPLVVHGQNLTNLILTRYADRQCSGLAAKGGGEQLTQSWVLKDSSPFCYEITAGLACNFRCFVKMGCDYGTGSGVTFSIYDGSSCVGTPTSVLDMASGLTWLEAVDFFGGNCTTEGPGLTTYMQFNKPVPSWPNCSVFGAASGAEAGYEANYVMQFYSDRDCIEKYQLSTFSTLTESRFKFWLHRGAQYCYDYIDDTPTAPNVSARARVGKNYMNFRMVCGNTDGLGNGIMLAPYMEPGCKGATGDPKMWRDQFYPMNKIAVTSLFGGECIRWGQFWVKMDSAWDSRHYPNCKAYACKTGYCSGGKISQAYTGAVPHTGDIATAQTRAYTLPSNRCPKSTCLCGAVTTLLAFLCSQFA